MLDRTIHVSRRVLRIWPVFAVAALMTLALPLRDALAQPPVAASLEWSPPENLSDTPTGISRYPDITVDGLGVVHVVWIEQDDLTEIGQDPLFGTGFGFDATRLMYADRVAGEWSPSIDIDYAGGTVGFLIPQIASDPLGALYVLYLNGSQHKLIRSAAGEDRTSARGWGAPSIVSPLWESPGVERFGDLVIDESGALDVRYATSRTNNPESNDVWFTRSTDDGARWQPSVSIGSAGADPLYQVRGFGANWALDEGGVLHAVVYAPDNEDQAIYIRSEDSGQSWSDPLAIGPTPTQSAWVTTVGGGVHVFWADTTRAIYHQSTDDRGATWSAPEQVTPTGIELYGGIGLASDSAGNLLMAYPEQGDIWTRVLGPDGWSSPLNVSQSPDRTDFWPRVAVANGNAAHLVWYSGFQELALYDTVNRMTRGEYEIYYAQAQTGAPEVAPAQSASVARATAEAAGTPLAPTPIAITTSTPAPQPSPLSDEARSAPRGSSSSLLFGIIPAILVVLIVVIVQFRRR